MARTKPTPHVERPGPAEFRDPMMRDELRRAAVWMGLALVIAGVIVLAEPLLLIIGGLVFSVILDGGTRLLGRVLPIGRGWRLAIVVLAGFGFIAWVFYFAGTTLAAQAEALRAVVNVQFSRLMALASQSRPGPGGRHGVDRLAIARFGRAADDLGRQRDRRLHQHAADHRHRHFHRASSRRLYDRGVAWMLPLRHRHKFYIISNRVGSTLRRLLFGRLVGMVFEGIFTFVDAVARRRADGGACSGC